MHFMSRCKCVIYTHWKRDNGNYWRWIIFGLIAIVPAGISRPAIHSRYHRKCGIGNDEQRSHQSHSLSRGADMNNNFRLLLAPTTPALHVSSVFYNTRYCNRYTCRRCLDEWRTYRTVSPTVSANILFQPSNGSYRPYFSTSIGNSIATSCP